jgi:C-terminal processing protease CtpA/Prc
MGLSVTTVEPNGALGQAGLRRNDRIISADGRAFNNPRQLEAYLWGQSGRAVPLIVERGGERHTIQANIPLHSANSGWLGIFLDEGDAKVQGALVAQVYPSGPAARAGIQVGDVIKQINSKEVIASHDAVMMLREFPPKAEITLTIQRDDEDLMLPVTVGSRTHFANHPSQVAPQHLPQSALQQPGQQANSTEAGSDPTHPFQGVPPYAMQLENDRRMAEQHERIEEELKLLRAEIQKLRELIEKK